MAGWYTSFTELSKEDRLTVAKEMRDEAWTANLEWLESAQLAQKFKAGDQWSDDEKFKLEQQGREALVWNYIHPTVELAVGIESQNPVRIYPYPVEKSDDFLCEVLEDIVKYIDTSQLDAADEHKTLFENELITGVGDVVVDVGPDPANPEELQFYEFSLEGYEVLVDPMCRKSNLSDARYIIYEKWITAEDFHIRYPKHIKDMEEIFTDGLEGLGKHSDHSLGYLDQDVVQADSFEFYDSQNKRVLVSHLEYRIAYLRYYFISDKKEITELTKKEYNLLKKEKISGQLTQVYDTKIHWLHYTHDRILWEGDSPVYKKNFSLCRARAYIDRSTRQHKAYGLVKGMIDPQKECNRRWMHTLKLLGKQGVGVMAEIDAFHDLTQAQDSWADPDAITFMTKGGLNKVKEKSVPQFPDAPMKLEEMNREAMKMISGVNPDLMGIAQQRREPGINLRLRQQQGLTILAKLFANHRAALKEVYKRKIEIIVRFMPETQIRKILGETEKYTFQQGYIVDQQRGMIAPIRKIRDLNYNIRMEEAPGGLTKMMAELATFMEMMEKGFPVDPFTVIDKLDLSPIEKANWKNYIKQQEEGKQKLQGIEMQMKAKKLESDDKHKTAQVQNESKKLEIMAKGKMQDGAISREQIAQKDTDSKRDLAAKMADMDADEKSSMLELLKFVVSASEKQAAAPQNNTPTNVTPT